MSVNYVYSGSDVCLGISGTYLLNAETCSSCHG